MGFGMASLLSNHASRKWSLELFQPGRQYPLSNLSRPFLKPVHHCCTVLNLLFARAWHRLNHFFRFSSTPRSGDIIGRWCFQTFFLGSIVSKRSMIFQQKKRKEKTGWYWACVIYITILMKRMWRGWSKKISIEQQILNKNVSSPVWKNKYIRSFDKEHLLTITTIFFRLRALP